MDERRKERNDNIRNCVSVSPYFAGGDKLMASWNDICDRAERRVDLLTRQLIDMKVRAVHPNDGWVKRNDGVPYEVQFSYPDFMDTIVVGDKVALKRSQEKRLNNADVVELFIVTGINDDYGRRFTRYNIDYSGERFIYHDDGRLESTGYVNKDYNYYRPEFITIAKRIISKIGGLCKGER
jgi:hypothetical protein